VSQLRRLAGLVAASAIVVGCAGGPILANPPLAFPAPPTASPGPTIAADPIPIKLPRDDGPHDRLTEWWYYTGHLATDDGRTFGFEAVVFRAERGAVPVAWAAHLALTDEAGNHFYYAQRSEIGVQVDRSPRAADGTPYGFDLDVSGLSPTLIAGGAPPVAEPWRLTGSNGLDRITATLAREEATAAGAAFGFDLSLRALKPPALHHGAGFVDFGPAGSSYYYSRTRLSASGKLQLNGQTLNVTGIAWFDHQWGDFVSVGGGGWDWFAINLDDGTDITFSIVRDEHAVEVLGYGTLVRPNGEVVNLQEPNDFGVGPGGFGGWQSPRSGVNYPTSWNAFLQPDTNLTITPTVADQELDTRATTGVVYWEGSELVTGLRGDIPISGRGYVEITRYELPGG
jgi:predicted secreted hydrolase